MKIADLPEINRFTFSETDCPVCGARDATLRHFIKKFAQGDLTFVTCNHCRTVYQNPRPDAASMQNFYMSQNFFWRIRV